MRRPRPHRPPRPRLGTEDRATASLIRIALAVLPGREVSISDWGRLREHIEDLRTLYTFDLVDMTEVSDELRKEIESEGIPL
ncbi:hypothetical protein [Thioalkalivibrio sp. ALM2T]|uniref:hypothetical protein n=1 Tax=Thioalkalivibrio sp. ALM2T TaxID=1158184 RepID=UPI003510AEAA